MNIHRLPARESAQRLSVVLTERVTVGALSAYELVSLGRYPHTNWAGTLTEKDHGVIRWAMQTAGAAEFAQCPVEPLVRAVERLAQPGAVHWLEHVIHRVHFKGPHCILIVSRHEGDERRPALLEQADPADQRGSDPLDPRHPRSIAFSPAPARLSKSLVLRFRSGYCFDSRRRCFFHSAATVGGKVSSRFKKAATCQMSSSASCLPQAGMAVFRIPCLTIQKISASVY